MYARRYDWFVVEGSLAPLLFDFGDISNPVPQIKIFHALLISIKHAPCPAGHNRHYLIILKIYTFIKFPYCVTYLKFAISGLIP
jgi:hypothetical protein